MNPVDTIPDHEFFIAEMRARDLETTLIKTVEFPDGINVRIEGDRLVEVSS